MKIVVHVPNWIGDSILAFPFLESLSLNFPEDEVWVAARDWVKDLFVACDFVEGTISLSSPEHLKGLRHSAQALKASRFDLGILVPNSFSSALLFYLAKISERWGYKRDGRSIFLTRSIAVPKNTLHQAQYYLELLTGLGLKADVNELNFPLREDEKKIALEYLRTQNVDLANPLVILHPGAAYGPAKRWPAQNYARLADLIQEKAKATILIIGSLAEAKTAEDLSSAMTGEAVNLTGQTSLRLLAGLISLASLFISNDSGPMHLANALRIPVVALFGPSDPRRTRPFQPPSTVIKKDVPCWPCRYRVCPFDHRCMMNIAPEEVYTAGVKYLG
jgi:heptosyltransferase-2